MKPTIHVYFGAKSEGALLASCALTIIPNLTRGGRPYGIIENVVTHTDFRRRGLGKSVIAAALNRCWHRDCYKVMLMAGINSYEVHAFYEALGFDKYAKLSASVASASVGG